MWVMKNKTTGMDYTFNNLLSELTRMTTCEIKRKQYINYNHKKIYDGEIF